MKSLIFSFFLFLTINSFSHPLAAISYDSCEGPSIYTSNGIKLGEIYGSNGNIDSVIVTSNWTFTVFVHWKNCLIHSYVITYGSDTVYKASGPNEAVVLFQRAGV